MGGESRIDLLSKMHEMKIAFLFSIIFFSLTATFAVSPVPIDVTSLTISKTGQNTDAIVTMEATGIPGPYSSPMTGYGEALWRGLEGCFPCGTGSIFHMNWDSTGNGNFVNGFYPNGFSNSTQVKFTVTATAPDIELNPRVSRKKKPLVFTGASQIKGKIEIINQTGVVAVDDDVFLNGTVKTEINNFLVGSQTEKRGFSYKSILFSYSK